MSGNVSARISELNKAASDIQWLANEIANYKSEIKSAWDSDEVRYIMNALDDVKKQCTNTVKKISTVTNDMRSAQDDIDREKRAERERILKEQLEKMKALMEKEDDK